LLLWTTGMAVIISLRYGIGAGPVADVLTDSENVRKGVMEMWVWIALIPAVSAWAFIYDGFYVGLTATRRMMLATIAATAVFFLLAFLRVGSNGVYVDVENNGQIWTAFLAYLLMRGFVLVLLWKSTLSKRMGLE
ncbi:MAG: hypothetical protein K2K64_10045, partial [Muribaculaceae bacterium]|nr:hypothetical protein [Muribaculaceae bacterium]